MISPGLPVINLLAPMACLGFIIVHCTGLTRALELEEALRLSGLGLVRRGGV